MCDGNIPAMSNMVIPEGNEQPIAIVTGANTGIGRDVAGLLAVRGYHVVLACRSEHRAKEALKELEKEYGRSISLEFLHLDLAKFSSVHHFVKSFSLVSGPLKLLVCNAGINANLLGDNSELSEVGIQTIYQVNFLSHLLLTLLLLPRLAAAEGARVVNVTSVMHRWADVGCFDRVHETLGKNGGMYGLSKLAQILSTIELHRRHSRQGIAFHSINPGCTKSDIWRESSCITRALVWLFGSSNKAVAATVIAVCTHDMCGVTAEPGYYNSHCGAGFCRIFEYVGVLCAGFTSLVPSMPSKAAQDKNLARCVWEQSLEFLRSKGFQDDAWS